MKQGTVEKLMRFTVIHSILEVVFKLTFSKMTQTGLNLVTNLIPVGLWHWKILLGEGLINFKILFLKML